MSYMHCITLIIFPLTSIFIFSVIFSNFTEWCDHHHKQILEQFNPSNKIPHAHLYLIFIIMSRPRWLLHLLSVSINLPPLDMSYKWNLTIYSLLCLDFLTLCNVFNFSHVVACIKISFPFLCWKVPLSYWYATFCFDSPVDGHLIVPSLGPLEIKLLWKLLYKFLCGICFHLP